MLLHCRTVSGHGDMNAKRPAILLMQVDQTLTIGGWVKTGREAGGGKWIFLEVNDGTSFQSLQVTPQSSLRQHLSTCLSDFKSVVSANLKPLHHAPGMAVPAAPGVRVCSGHRFAGRGHDAPLKRA